MGTAVDPTLDDVKSERRRHGIVLHSHCFLPPHTIHYSTSSYRTYCISMIKIYFLGSVADVSQPWLIEQLCVHLFSKQLQQRCCLLLRLCDADQILRVENDATAAMANLKQPSRRTPPVVHGLQTSCSTLYYFRQQTQLPISRFSIGCILAALGKQRTTIKRATTNLSVFWDVFPL